jgi:hypothetical protein
VKNSKIKGKRRGKKKKKTWQLDACSNARNVVEFRVFVASIEVREEPFQAWEGGIFRIPCRCSSPKTPSRDGGFRPRGRGSHGLDNTSPIAASTLSFVCLFNTYRSTKQLA